MWQVSRRTIRRSQSTAAILVHWILMVTMYWGHPESLRAGTVQLRCYNKCQVVWRSDKATEDVYMWVGINHGKAAVC